LLGAYILGANFLARGNVTAVAAGGIPIEDLRKVFTAGPISSEQILHPAKYWDPAQQDLPLPVSLGEVGKRLGDGWQIVDDGEFGELNLGTLIGLELPSAQDLGTFDPTVWSDPAVAGWGGDRWELWSHSDGRSVVLLSTRWDSKKDAAEFHEALAERSFAVALKEDRVAIVAGELAAAHVKRLLKTLLSARQQ